MSPNMIVTHLSRNYPHVSCLADVDSRLGDWAAAYVAELSSSLMRRAAVEAGQGRIADCRAHVEIGLAIGERLGIGSVLILGGSALGLLAVSCCQYREAITRLEATGRLAAEQGLTEPSVAPWAQELAEAHIRSGEHVAAEAVLSELEPLARAADSRGALAAVSRCHGLLVGDVEFEQHFVEALRRHERIEEPFGRARTELCFGERLRRAGRRVDAREPLRSAMATFGRLGATPWAERAGRELAATGERVRPRSTVTRDRLTAQETQVALAVAQGRTNREAAATLFVSPKTIETHLSRVYRKLEIRSRSELTRLMLSEGVGAR